MAEFNWAFLHAAELQPYSTETSLIKSWITVDKNEDEDDIETDWDLFAFDLLDGMKIDEHAIRFTHGCLRPSSILVNGNYDIVAILNWVQAGWYPGY